MILGGDQLWTRRLIGVSTCPQVGSMFNEVIWRAQKKTWEGRAHYTHGLPSWDAFFASRFESTTCLGCLVHFALDNGHGPLVGGVCQPGG